VVGTEEFTSKIKAIEYVSDNPSMLRYLRDEIMKTARRR
jgi:hypothetical protein